MQAPRYFLPQSSLSTKLDSRALAIALLLTPWHKPHCPKCCQSHIPYCRQLQIPATYHLLDLSLWYLVLAIIDENCHESFIFWAIQAYKLVCLLGVTFEKDQETWLPACDSAWFWGACYSARLYCLGRSFVAWHLYCGLAFKVFGRGKGFVGK